jgi:hypothetical protein
MWFRSLHEDRELWKARHSNRLRWAVLLGFGGFGVIGVLGRLVAIFHENLVDRLLPMRTPWNTFIILGSAAFGVWFWVSTRANAAAEAEGSG